MEGGELKTEKAFIIGNYEDLLPANDPDFQRIQKTRLDGNVVHISTTDHTGYTDPDGLWEYMHRDHLGSVEKVTDSSGAVILDTAFEPDGRRRQSDWSGQLDSQGMQDLLAAQGLTTRRGFTGHEHMDRTGLIHMNGRIYDPTLGRFLSPDPIVQAPAYSQSWNRYSYAFNNPLSLVDPTGYSAEEEEDETKPIDCGQGCSGQGDPGAPDPIEEVETEGSPGGGRGPTIGGGGGWQPTTMGQIWVMSGGSPGNYGRGSAPAASSTEKAKDKVNEGPDCDTLGGGCVTVTATKDGKYLHEDPLGVGSILSTLMGVSFMGERTFLGRGWQRIPRTPITHEKMLIHNYATKAKISGVLKAGGNTLGVAGYGVSLYEYGDSMQDGNYRDARKAGVDMFMGAIMFEFPFGTAVGAVGLYVNQHYHSDPDNL